MEMVNGYSSQLDGGRNMDSADIFVVCRPDYWNRSCNETKECWREDTCAGMYGIGASNANQ